MSIVSPESVSPFLDSVDHLRLLAVKLEFEALTAARLPAFKGSMMRGALGFALKKWLCACSGRCCAKCQLPQQCSYSYLFETNLANYRADSGQELAHPFVLTPLESGRESYRKGDTIHFRLVLFGEGRRYLHYLLMALLEAGEEGLGRQRSRFRLRRVQAIRPGGSPLRIFTAGDTHLVESEISTTPAEICAPYAGIDATRVRLRFRTPVRIKDGGRLTDSLSLEKLSRRLLGRLAALSYFHHGRPLRLDPGELLRVASTVTKTRDGLAWRDWERRSSRRGRAIKMGGLTGEVIFEGGLQPLMPLLALGEWIQVGSGTSCGLGYYQIEEVFSS